MKMRRVMLTRGRYRAARAAKKLYHATKGHHAMNCCIVFSICFLPNNKSKLCCERGKLVLMF